MGENRGVSLKIAEALPKDVGRNFARFDPGDFSKLGVEIGDIVALVGRRRTAARVMPAFSDDRNKGIIQIDGIARENVQGGLGDKINVYKAEPVLAQEIILVPLGTVPAGRMIKDSSYLGKVLEGVCVTSGDRVRVNLFGASAQDFRVTVTKPDGLVLIKASTRAKIRPSDNTSEKKGLGQKISYEDIGGLSREVQRIREMIELPLKYPQIFEHLGIEAPKGVLLVGPPGTGKTLIAKAVAGETDANFIQVSGPEIIAKFYGESEANLREIFERARANAPSIIFLDELDGIAPKRAEVTGEVEKRVVTQLLALMDGLESRQEVIVIGATNRPDALDSALRRPGRFDREINIGVPDKNGRLKILQIHTRGMPLASNVELVQLANMTHGFVGADLASLCREAAMITLRSVLPEIDMSQDYLPYELLRDLTVSMEHFIQALAEIEPSAIREVFVENPNIHWDQIGGLVEVKQELQEAIEWPLKYERLYQQALLPSPKGILLYGPPGTGKTLLAKAIATECQANFISIKGPELLSKWVGESEKGVREIFKKARQVAPCIIFFDELDAMAPRRQGGNSGDATMGRIVGQLLTEIDGLEKLKSVNVVAATNRPDLIDEALLRPGRFDLILEIPLPDLKERELIFGVHTNGRTLADDVMLVELAKQTEGWSGAQIELACNNATRSLVRNCIMTDQLDSVELVLQKQHFQTVISKLSLQKSASYYKRS